MIYEKNRENSHKYVVGIDAGSVSLNSVVINEHKEIISESDYMRHLGKVEEEVLRLIHELYEKLGSENLQAFAFTGNHGQKISQRMGGFYEFETISQVLGALYVEPTVRTIISMGGQDTALFLMPTVHVHLVLDPLLINRHKDWPHPSMTRM
jgi:activator of 2-hydroxyglutaryl-CoA dehydratase